MLQIADFYADPKAFLEENVVRVNGGDIPLKTGENRNQVYRLILELDGDWKKVVDGNGATIGGVYHLKRDDHAAAGIDAYFCPYKSGETNWVTLGVAAYYMFTPAMDGCTFGIGNDAKGALIAGHANAAVGKDWLEDAGEDEARARQRQVQFNTLRYRISSNAYYFRPEDYMANAATRATTFGVLRKDGWKFYTACYWTDDYSTYQVQPVQSGCKGMFNKRLPKWLI